MAHCRHTVQLSKNASSIKAPLVRNSIAHPPSNHIEVSNCETIRQNIDGESGVRSGGPTERGNAPFVPQQIEQPSNTKNTNISIGLN